MKNAISKFKLAILLSLTVVLTNQLQAQSECGCTTVATGYLSTNALPNPYTQPCLKITGTLIVDANFSIQGTASNHVEIQMAPGAKIQVLFHRRLSLLYCDMEACYDYDPWDRIVLNSTASLSIVKSNLSYANTFVEGLGVNEITIDNSVLKKGIAGVHVTRGADVEIVGSAITVEENAITLIRTAHFVSYFNIEYNEIVGKNGVLMNDMELDAGSPHIQVTGNLIKTPDETSSFAGILFAHSTPNVSPFSFVFITGNEIQQNKGAMGIFLNNASGVTVSANRVLINHSGNQTPFSRGIAVWGANESGLVGNLVEGFNNTLSSTMIGIDLVGSTNCIVDGNEIVNTDTGVKVVGDCSSPNQFFNNSFNRPGEGTMGIGLHMASADAALGTQNCAQNKWYGTYTMHGAKHDGTISTSIFNVSNSDPTQTPPNASPSTGWFNPICPGVSGGGVEQRRTSNHKDSTGGEVERLMILPNPNNGSFRISLTEEDQPASDILIFDTSGKLALRPKVFPGSNEVTICDSELVPGVYLVKFGNKVEKLVITD